MIRLLKFKLSFLFVLPFLSGCSVYMASQGSTAPDVSVIEIGQHRAAVDEALGKPISFTRKWQGDEAEYIYFGPSEHHYGRAALYAVADIVTIGLAEFVTTPAEHMQREQFRVIVIYDRNGRVSEYTHYSKGVPTVVPKVSPQKMVSR